MTRQLLIMVIAMAIAISAAARETIGIAFPYAPTHSIAPLFFPLIDGLNAKQNKYNFVLEAKPGANGIIALQHMNQSPNNRIAVIAAAFVDNVDDGKIRESDYVHIVGLGNMCQSVAFRDGDEVQGIKSIQGKVKDLTLGGVAWGNSSHLIGLNIGEMLNIPVRNIVFKSNREGLMNMFNDDGVNYVFDGTAQIRNVPSLAKITPKILAVACDKRLKELPTVKTLDEQGITAPGPWAAITTNRSMTDSRRQEVAKLIEDELKIIGEEKVQQLSTLKPLVFTKQSLDSFYEKKASAARAHLARYRTMIDADRGTTKK